MTAAVGELTGRLKKMGGDEVVLCNLYSVVDLRDCIGGCCGSGDALDGMTDEEVLDEFCKRYDVDEDEAYWSSGRDVGGGLTVVAGRSGFSSF